MSTWSGDHNDEAGANDEDMIKAMWVAIGFALGTKLVGPFVVSYILLRLVRAVRRHT